MAVVKKLGFFCSSTSMGGLEMNTARLARWMKGRGWKVFLYCVKDTPLERFAIENGLEIRLIKKHRKYYDFKAAKRLNAMLEEDEVKVMLFRDTRDMSLLVLAKSKSKGKLRLIYQQAMQLGVAKRDVIHTLRFSKIDIWISLLDFLAKQVKNQTRFDHDKIRVIPLGMELDRFNKDVLSQEAARDKLALPQGIQLAGVIGRFDPQKGQDTAIKALHHIRKSGKDFGLVLLGEPTRNEGSSFEDSLHALVKEYGLEEHVFFRPFMKKVEIFYRSIDQFWMTSLGETFGTVTIEAMASRLPIIGTDASGTPELLGNGEFGRLIPPNDALALSEQAILLLENPSQTNQMANRAVVEAARFDYRIVCASIERAIIPLLEE